jgi:Na+(H+)/acetate symporter ActP
MTANCLIKQCVPTGIAAAANFPSVLTSVWCHRMLPGEFFSGFMVLWLAGLSGLLLYRILTRQISITGILTVDRNTFSPSRLQLLLVTLSGLAAYATSSLSAGKLVPITNSEIAIFAASHATYIGAKAHSALYSKVTI